MSKQAERRSILLNLCRQNGTFTKQEAVSLIGGCYYHNADKHVGEVLSRMVKAGILARVKKGIYKLGIGSNQTTQVEDPKQTKLF